MMSCVDFKIIKDGKDTEKVTGIICGKTISVDLLAAILESYPKSEGYELVLDKIWDQKIEEKEKENGKH